MTILKKRSMVKTVRRRPLKADAWVRFEDIPSNVCHSTSVLRSQYYSAHNLYSSSSNVVRTRRNTVKAWKPSKSND